MHRGSALIIATSAYDRDPELTPLPSVIQDAAGLEEVLGDSRIGNFLVTPCLESSAHECRETIERFFSQGSRDELQLLYITGHGLKDADGELHFAVRNTLTSLLTSTSISASFIKEVSRRSKARGIVTVLDTCFAGAFAGRAPMGTQVGVADHFREGRSRVVITASDSFQHALGGDRTGSRIRPSLFSSHVIQGLKSGDADMDGDGEVSSTDLFNYVRERMKQDGSNQRPQRWNFMQDSNDLVVAMNPRPRLDKMLPPEILVLAQQELPSLRLDAIVRLQVLLSSDSVPLGLAARELLRRMQNDPNPAVAGAASNVVLGSGEDFRRQSEEAKFLAQTLMKKVATPLPPQGRQRTPLGPSTHRDDAVTETPLVSQAFVPASQAQTPDQTTQILEQPFAPLRMAWSVAASLRRRFAFTAAFALPVMVMAAVLLFNLIVTTQLRDSVTALQAASLLQAYPDEISQRLTALRDRLEGHATAGQAQADLKAAAGHFNHELDTLRSSASPKDLPELSEALSRWTQFAPLINPATRFTGQPYIDSDDGTNFSQEGRELNDAVKQALMFANDNTKTLQASLLSVAPAVQRSVPRVATRIRRLLAVGAIAPVILGAMMYFQLWRIGAVSRLRPAFVTAVLVIVIAGEAIPAISLGVVAELDVSSATLPQLAAVLAYPDEISQRLSSLRGRLEARRYAGQALEDLKTAVERLQHELDTLRSNSRTKDLPELSRALSLWTQFTRLINPVINFTGQPYIAGDDGNNFSQQGREQYNAVKQAQLFANENKAALQATLDTISTALQHSLSGAANLLAGLMAGMIVNFLALLLLVWFRCRPFWQ